MPQFPLSAEIMILFEGRGWEEGWLGWVGQLLNSWDLTWLVRASVLFAPHSLQQLRHPYRSDR